MQFNSLSFPFVSIILSRLKSFNQDYCFIKTALFFMTRGNSCKSTDNFHHFFKMPSILKFLCEADVERSVRAPKNFMKIIRLIHRIDHLNDHHLSRIFAVLSFLVSVFLSTLYNFRRSPLLLTWKLHSLSGQCRWTPGSSISTLLESLSKWPCGEVG